MRTQSTTLFNQISRTAVKELTTEVKERLDLDYGKTPIKNFSAAELWNIQKQHKSINQRRRFV